MTVLRDVIPYGLVGRNILLTCDLEQSNRHLEVLAVLKRWAALVRGQLQMLQGGLPVAP